MIADPTRPRFADVVDAADRLSLDEQEELIEIVSRRVQEAKRETFINRALEASEELHSGKLVPKTVEQIMREAKS